MVKFSYIDIHAHLNFSAFDEDREEVIARMENVGIGAINVGTQKDTSAKAVSLAEAHQNQWAIVGLHPVHTEVGYHTKAEIGVGGSPFNSRGEAFDREYYLRLARMPKVIGIGECGLDYFHVSKESKEHQANIFVAHIELANTLRKPLMLHIRNGKDSSVDAYEDALTLLRSHAKVPGNVHFFAGSIEQARSFLNLGFTISFTGVITFADSYRELVRFVPLDMMHIETDCPFVAPVPYRGKRNEPSFLPSIGECVAEIRQNPIEKIQRSLLQNAERLFGISLEGFEL